jgi:hypothetical protein
VAVAAHAPLLAVAADEVEAVAQAEEERLVALEEPLAVEPALRERAAHDAILL